MKVLDAFAGRGGSTAGYKARGHQVVAVDISDFSEQNPADVFVVADAVDFIREQGHQFDFIHMSAPCQFWTRGNASRRADGTNPHPRLIAAARHAALATGRPFVIENVEDAAAELRDPILLCGRMFGLSATDTDGTPLIMDRHRLFEFGNMDRPHQPAHHQHKRTTGIGFKDLSDWDARRLPPHVVTALVRNYPRTLTGQPHVAGAYGAARRDKWEAKYIRKGGYVPADLSVLQELMGTPHITDEVGIFEAIPSAYASWIIDHVSALEVLVA